MVLGMISYNTWSPKERTYVCTAVKYNRKSAGWMNTGTQCSENELGHRDQN